MAITFLVNEAILKLSRNQTAEGIVINLVGGIKMGDQDRPNSLWDDFNFDHKTYFVGGQRGNDFYGLGGADVFTGGVDVYHYMTWNDSLKDHADLITGFDFFTDKIDLRAILPPGQQPFVYVDPYMTDTPGILGGPERAFHLIISDTPYYLPGHTIDIDILTGMSITTKAKLADTPFEQQGTFLEQHKDWLLVW